MVKHDEEIVEAKKQELIKTISADMVGRLRRALEQALDWAKQDGEIEKYGDQLPPNLRVMELKGITETDEPESAVKSNPNCVSWPKNGGLMLRMEMHQCKLLLSSASSL